MRTLAILCAAGLALGEPAAANAVRPAAEKQYRWQLAVYEVQKDGAVHVLSRPQVLALEGQPFFVQIGQSLTLRAGADVAETDFAGITLKGQGTELVGGQLRIDLTIERKEYEQSDVETVRVTGRSTRMVKRITLGKMVKLVLEQKDDGKPRCWVEVEVEEVTPQQAPAPLPAPRAVPANGEGTPFLDFPRENRFPVLEVDKVLG
jgi:hypothetical protein